MKTAAIIALGVTLVQSQPPVSVDILTQRPTHSGGSTLVNVVVQNNSTEHVRSAYIECAFFQSGALHGVIPQIVDNIAPGQSVYASVTYTQPGPFSVTCRFVRLLRI